MSVDLISNMPKTTSEETTTVSQYWWLFLVQGIASIIIGWYLLSNPAITVFYLVLFLGLYWLTIGIVDVIFSILDAVKGGKSWGWKLVGGIIGVLAGLFILNQPLFAAIITPVMFMYIIAFTFIINGIVTMAVGSKGSEDGKKEWSWANFFLGLFYFFFGFILLTSPTLVSVASLVFAAGIMGLAGGVMFIILGFRVKSANKE